MRMRHARVVAGLRGQSVYNKPMANRVIRISDAKAASDFASLLDRVRAGDEAVIEHDARPVAVLRSPAPAQSIDKMVGLETSGPEMSGRITLPG